MAIVKRGSGGSVTMTKKASNAKLSSVIRTLTQDGELLAEWAFMILSGKSIRLESGSKLTPTMKDMRWAIEWLSERGFGKAREIVEVTRDDVESDVEEMSDGQIEEEAKRIIERRAAGAACSGGALPEEPGEVEAACQPDGLDTPAESALHEPDAPFSAGGDTGEGGGEGAGE